MSTGARSKKKLPPKAAGSIKPASNKLTPAQFAKSDQTAAKSGKNVSVGQVASACQKPETKTKPCDLAELTLIEVPGKKQNTWERVNGKWEPKPSDDPTRTISLFGTNSAAPKQPILQVVGDRPGVKAATKIKVQIKPFAVCGPAHVAVAVYPPQGSEIDHVSAGADSFEFEAARFQADTPAGSLFERYITWGLPPNVYLITAASCGFRPNGKANEGGSLQVEVYPADEYELELSVPALGSVSYSRDKTANDEGTTDKAEFTVVSGGESLSASSSLSVDENGVALLKDEIEEKSQEASLALTRNGQADDVSADLTKLLQILSSVQEAVKAIKDLIDGWVPQVGFKFEFELSFLAGTISMVWGYKEFTDWRVYYGWGAHFALTFFEISLTLSFGIQMPAFLAKLEGTCSGSAELKTDFDFNSPDTPIAPSVEIDIDIPAQMDGRAEAGIGWFSVSIELGVKSGFEGKAGLKTEGTKCNLYADIDWSGVTVYRKYKDSPNDGEMEDDWVVIQEREIMKRDLDF